MAKLSDEAKKKIAESVKRSWALRRARMAAKPGAKTAPGSADAKPSGKGKGRRRLSAASKRRIAEAVKRSWALRRGGKAVPAGKGKQGGAGPGVLGSVQQASNALRSLTLDDLRPLAGRRDAAAQLEELAALASDLKRLISR